jgi:hypothetical protein
VQIYKVDRAVLTTTCTICREYQAWVSVSSLELSANSLYKFSNTMEQSPSWGVEITQLRNPRYFVVPGISWLYSWSPPFVTILSYITYLYSIVFFFFNIPYFSIDNAHLMYNAHPKPFWHSFWCIDNALAVELGSTDRYWPRTQKLFLKRCLASSSDFLYR